MPHEVNGYGWERSVRLWPRDGHELGPGPRRGDAEQVFHMLFHGARRQVQPGRDLLVGDARIFPGPWPARSRRYVLRTRVCTDVRDPARADDGRRPAGTRPGTEEGNSDGNRQGAGRALGPGGARLVGLQRADVHALLRSGPGQDGGAPRHGVARRRLRRRLRATAGGAPGRHGVRPGRHPGPTGHRARACPGADPAQLGSGPCRHPALRAGRRPRGAHPRLRRQQEVGRELPAGERVPLPGRLTGS